MSNFEWETEDNYDWEQPEQKPPSGSNRYGQIGVIVAIVALLGALGWIVYNRLQETVETVSAETEDDVIASFELLHQAASARDIEVFNALLSGLDPDWTVGYQLMVGDEGLLDRSALGWELVSATPEIGAVVLSPSLRAAEITATVEYAIPIGNGLNQTVPIAQPAIFREGTTRWLYAPPEEGYWGGRETQTGNFISVTYPVRDRELVLELQRDLEVAISNRCGDSCGQTFIQVEFSTSPASLADLRTPPLAVENYNLILPTPTLVGLPTDSNGYLALLGGYGDLILTSLFSELSAYQCCDQLAYHRAQSLWALKESGLRAWPMTAEDYSYVYQAHSSFVEWPLGWEVNRPSAVSAELQTIAYAVIEFLYSTYPQTDPQFDIENIDNFVTSMDWMAAFTVNSGVVLSADSIDDWQRERFEEFQQFLVTRINQLEQLQPVQGSPSHQLMLACNTNTGAGLHQYDPTSRSWAQAATFNEPISEIGTLPNQSSLWIQMGDPDEISTSFEGTSGIWQDNSFTPLTNLRLSYAGAANPQNGALVVKTPFSSNNDGSAVPPTYYELDPSNCSSTGCPLTRQEGIPIWSENGQHSLVLSNRNLLVVQDAAGNQLDDHFSIAGFWLDNETYIWQPTLLNLVASSVVEPDVRDEWVGWAQLSHALPEGVYNVPSITHVFWRDEQPEQLYVGLLSLMPNSSGNVAFWDRDLASAEFLPYENVQIQWASPNEDYLLLREIGRTENDVEFTRLHLYDTVKRAHHQTFSATRSTVFSWIGDSDDWASLTIGDQMQIIHVPTGERSFVQFPTQACVSGDWILPSSN